MEKLQRKLAENVPEGAEIPEKLTIGQAEKILLERMLLRRIGLFFK